MEDILSPKQVKKLIINLVILVGLLISALTGWWQIETNQNKGMLRVSFLDVGQGDAIFIETPNKVQTIIDTGPNAQILGIDIEPECKNLEKNNTKIEIGSQSDIEFLKKIADKYGKFDVIVDDGSHMNYYVKFTFNYLFNLIFSKIFAVIFASLYLQSLFAIQYFSIQFHLSPESRQDPG